jgi:hypothetical protein
MNRLAHAQPYWSKPGPSTIPRIPNKDAAKKWLMECDRNGWTPLMEESFRGRIDNVLGILRLAKRAYGDAGLREYVRRKDDIGMDACGWASLRTEKSWPVIELLTKYGAH